MSDYLWDKSGEADPEIERLENLLAARRYEPAPLQVPHAVTDRAVPQAYRPRRVLQQVAALAAGIVLAVITGVWMHGKRQDVRTENMVVAARDELREASFEEPRQPSAPGSSASVLEVEQASGIGSDGIDEERSGRRTRERIGTVRRERRTMKLRIHVPLNVARVARRTPGRISENGNSSVAPEDAGDAELLASLPEERAQAKEQLMLAMRMTSQKLNAARDRTQAAHAADGETR